MLFLMYWNSSLLLAKRSITAAPAAAAAAEVESPEPAAGAAAESGAAHLSSRSKRSTMSAMFLRSIST